MNTHTRKNVLWVRQNLRLARSRWGKHLGAALEQALATWSREFRISIASGDLLLIEGKWYVTHSGLLRLARRKKCCGIHVDVVPEFCDQRSSRWTCRATVYKSPTCRGFVGHGHATPVERRSVDLRLRISHGGNPSGDLQGAQESICRPSLFGRGDRILRWSTRFASRVQEAAAACQWQREPRRSHRPRSPYAN